MKSSAYNFRDRHRDAIRRPETREVGVSRAAYRQKNQQVNNLDIQLDRPPLSGDEFEIDNDEVACEIGERIKELRRERNWTLTKTAEQTGLSHSALSRIERNELSPTLGSLNKIARGFSIDVITLLSGRPAQPAAARRSINRHSHGLVANTHTCSNIWLAADLTQKRMLPLKTRVVARHPDEYSDWATHAGELFLYVLSGELLVHSKIYAPVKLAEGDSLYYDAHAGHKWVSVGTEDAVVLWVFAD